MEHMTVALINHTWFGLGGISVSSGTDLVGTPGQARFCVKRFHTNDEQKICGYQENQ